MSLSVAGFLVWYSPTIQHATGDKSIVKQIQKLNDDAPHFLQDVSGYEHYILLCISLQYYIGCCAVRNGIVLCIAFATLGTTAQQLCRAEHD